MRCSRFPTTTAAAASHAGSSRRAGARTKERKATTVDPALAARVKDAVRLLTGFDAKVGAAGLHIPVDGEVQLEELAEALERLATP